MPIAVFRAAEGFDVQLLRPDGQPASEPRRLTPERFVSMARHPDNAAQTYVLERSRYPCIELRTLGLRLRRAHDLWLIRRILRNSPFSPDSPYVRSLRAAAEPRLAADPEDRPWLREAPMSQDALFEAATPGRGRPAPVPGLPNASARGHNARTATSVHDVAREYRAQIEAIAASADPRRLGLLVRAESAGALVAADLEYDGLPWDRAEHERLLVERVGPRVPDGVRPRELELRAQEIERLLGVGPVNPDSPADLLRALKRAGFGVSSTRKWELRPLADHEAIARILDYKKVSRLATANGWAWLDTWVHGGRLRSEYVPGGVPSGRWVSLGGGLMQLPRELRATVRADPGRRLVVADVSQLEPRVLAAMSRDSALAEAARGHDLYQNIADEAFEGQRGHAKIAVLGAIYGATTGEAGAYMPVLSRAYPQAVALVAKAAHDGELGLQVQSLLGRGTPVDGVSQAQAESLDPVPRSAPEGAGAKARGRFARNFVVQGTAAEWALCWLGTIRTRLLDEFGGAGPRPTAELVYFLHDEVILHVDEDAVDAAVRLVSEAADQATRTMFGEIPVDFPLSTAAVTVYAETKE
ncbi:bifunctional 3'-5' exonuclease/DNA polymerase [Falsarthrobacter nasiphocae]|uniref:DNA-directed DNA polymerase n=1 Tax=Falsarthrobacter nasiphocae TaxID=189863 RepID=A0AAE3YFR7_9MICC|nr:bifunctional 3'-5' exonuclease/DNA polymerase [Falsarthrobacter nasiphocae]MDR6892350.1 DNA polymerase-1 [Falsarthrobacter nasiphocae]